MQVRSSLGGPPLTVFQRSWRFPSCNSAISCSHADGKERKHGEPTLAFNYLGPEGTCDFLHSFWWKCSHMVTTREAGKCSLPTCSGCAHGVVVLWGGLEDPSTPPFHRQEQLSSRAGSHWSHQLVARLRSTLQYLCLSAIMFFLYLHSTDFFTFSLQTSQCWVRKR